MLNSLLVCRRLFVDTLKDTSDERSAPPQGHPEFTREKDRVIYEHQHFKIDLTQVTPSGQPEKVRVLPLSCWHSSAAQSDQIQWFSLRRYTSLRSNLRTRKNFDGSWSCGVMVDPSSTDMTSSLPYSLITVEYLRRMPTKHAVERCGEHALDPSRSGQTFSDGR